MKDTHNTVRGISEIAIFAAIGYALDELQGIIGKSLFVSGGSIGIAMIVVLIIALRRGWLAAISTGLIIGLFDFATGAFIIHPAQALLDYIFPYAVVGLAGIFAPIYHKTDKKVLWLILLTIIGGMFKFLSHYLAGVIFWNDAGSFAWGLNALSPYLYSFIYNIAYIGPTIILTAALLVLIHIKAPKLLTSQRLLSDSEGEINSNKTASFAVSGFYMTAGTVILVIFLIKFIQSIETYAGEGYSGFEASGESMVLFVLGGFVAILGVNNLLKTIVGKADIANSVMIFSSFCFISVAYGVAKLIRAYVKEEAAGRFWVWVIISLVTFIIALAIAINLKNKKREQEVEINEEKY